MNVLLLVLAVFVWSFPVILRHLTTRLMCKSITFFIFFLSLQKFWGTLKHKHKWKKQIWISLNKSFHKTTDAKSFHSFDRHWLTHAHVQMWGHLGLPVEAHPVLPVIVTAACTHTHNNTRERQIASWGERTHIQSSSHAEQQTQVVFLSSLFVRTECKLLLYQVILRKLARH